MKSITGNYYEVKVKVDKVMDDRTIKTVTEQYVCDALSLTEVEMLINNQVTTIGELEIISVVKAAYREVVTTNDSDENWHKVKVSFITLDEKTGKEKLFKVATLMQGSTVKGVQATNEELHKSTMLDYKVLSISETNIIDVFKHES